MQGLLLFLLGIAVGSTIVYIVFRLQSGRGYFIIDKVPEMEEMYTVNVRLDPDQQLHKKKWLRLRREYSRP